MLVRGALRLAADVPAKTHTHDLPQLARFLQRTLLARNASNTPAVRALSRAYRTALFEYRRSYATTTKATQPTATVKKAVKAQAAKKTAPTKKAAPKTTTAAKPRNTVARKTVAKKTTAKKAALKKKAPKKAAPKKRVKKEVTPEAKKKAAIAALKKIALVEPVSNRVLTAYQAFTAELLAKKPGEQRVKLGDVKWASVTPAEREHYNHVARERTDARKTEYQAWIRSHTPQQIKEANNARTQLRRKLATKNQKRSPRHTTKLVDDRQAKRPVTPWIFFYKERILSGDFKGILAKDASRLCAEEWNALTEGEKKKYVDASAADQARYQRESSA